MHSDAGGATAPVSLTAWLNEPRPDCGLQFLAGDGTWRGPAYPEVADRILRMATAVRQRGLAGRRVGIIPAGAPDFIVQFFGLVAAGATCIPLPTQTSRENAVEYRRRVDPLLVAAKPDAIVGVRSGEVAGRPVEGLPRIRELEGVARGELVDVDPDHLTLIQFSSGSTGAQRAVRVSRRTLEAHLTAIRDWLEPRPDDRTASWLPFLYDMGLVGTMLTNLACQVHLMLMSPMQYLHRPHEWLRCFGREGATIGAAPGFGYLHACQKVKKEHLEGCDFSRWRIAIVGAEPLRAGHLEWFVDLLAPFGFRGRALCPAYGLSEATLAVTGVRPDDDPPVLPEGWRPEAAAGDVRGLRVRHGSLQADQVVGSGAPLDGAEVEVRDLEGDPVADGTLGEIWVGGTSLAGGYEPPQPESWPPGWFRTGDVGCMIQGQLFVFGRLSDSFQVAGEIVLAEQAEARIQGLVPDVSTLVVVPTRRDGQGITVVVESGQSWTAETAEELRRAVAELFKGVETDLVIVGRREIPRTPSGKPRRRECWRRYVAAT